MLTPPKGGELKICAPGPGPGTGVHLILRFRRRAGGRQGTHHTLRLRAWRGLGNSLRLTSKVKVKADSLENCQEASAIQIYYFATAVLNFAYVVLK